MHLTFGIDVGVICFLFISGCQQDFQFHQLLPLQISMFSSHKKTNNHSDIKSGETLFDFLKRKKKFALDQSFSKSRCKENVSQNKQHIPDSCSPRKKCQQTYRDTMRESSINYQTTRRNQNTSMTPKKVTFTEGQSKKAQNGRSSFVEMISPLRRRNNVDLNASAEVPALSKSRGKQREKQKQNTQEVFHRKNLNKSVGIMKSTLQRLINTGKTLKQKSHTLLIELKPLLKYIEEGENRNFARRADEAKLKLRTFEHLFKQFEIQNGNDLIEEFHRTLSEHIISMEGNIRSTYEKDEVAALRKIKIDKDDKIEQLNIRNEKLEKQVEVLTRKLDRSERSVNKLQKNVQDQSENYTKTLSTKITDYESRICQYEAEISQLAIELDNSKLVEKRLEKQIKDLKYLKEEAERRFISENITIKSQKQEILINEIEMLKSEFKNDMGQITALYSSKQKEQLEVIDQLKRQVGELHEQRKCDQDIYNRILEQNSNFKSMTDKFKKQNECLVTDLHRMNEQLYQHWLALKDIKTLSTRLGSFNKFAKIYDDIPYNSQLFL